MPFNPTLYVAAGRQSPIILDAGSNTIAFQQNGYWQTQSGDFIKRDAGPAQGLYERFVDRNPTGTVDHFTSGVIPGSHSWVNDGTFSGTPPTLTYSYSGTYLRAGAGAGNRYFLAMTGLGTWLGGHYNVRANAGHASWCAIRFDDGTDNNFYEMGLLAAGSTGICAVRYRYRTGGGAITNTDRTTDLLTDEFHCWRILVYDSGWPANWTPYVYWMTEVPAVNVIATGPAQTWAVSRVGITLDATISGSGSIWVDWLCRYIFA